MLTIDLTDAPNPIEERDKFEQYIGTIIDAFRVDPAEEAELQAGTNDSVMRSAIYYGIRAFLIKQACADPNIMIIIRNEYGKWLLKKLKLLKKEEMDHSGDVQNVSNDT